MLTLWRWVSLRHLFGEGARTLLTLLGVALGVAVFVSIRLANHSAMSAFAETVNTVAGKANLQVVADSEGFDERVFPAVRALPGVEAAAPVVQTYALAGRGAAPGQRTFSAGEKAPYKETLLVMGIDLFSERPFERYKPQGEGNLEALTFLTDPRAVAVTRTLADRLALKPGGPLTLLAGGRPVTLTVRQVLDSPELQGAMGGNVVFTDIATAQEVFSRYGKLDRIDLRVDPARKEEVTAALRALLPPQARAAQPQGRTRQVENMVQAFELNLTALSFIALFVSMFLIFNAISLSVLTRRREIGILRSVGVTRRSVVLQFLAEALSIGVVGSLLGLALGTLLAQATLGAVARTITALYLVVHARELHYDPVTYAIGFALGVGIALLSALAPAIEASRTSPSVTVRQGGTIEAQPLRIGRWTAAGIATLTLAALIAAWTVAEHRPLGGFVSAFLLLGGFSLLSPGFTLLGEKIAGPLLRATMWIEGLLGARYLRDAIARASVVVAALMVSVGMMIGLSIMVGSFRGTVSVWVNQTLKGDLYVEPVGRRETGSATVIPNELVEQARALPGVAAVDTYRGVEITYGGRIAYVAGVDFKIQSERGRLLFMEGDAATIMRRAYERDGVVITESFAFRHNVKTGDRLHVQTPSGAVSLPVEGVFYDYSTDAGAFMMDYRLFGRLWKDARAESVALYLEPGASVEAVRNQFIEAAAGKILLYVTPNQGLRNRVLTVFDQTFQITYALQAIAIFVAVLGVVNTLTALILQRGREIGVLRAVGALRRQVRKIVLIESGLLGLIGSLFGCVCGMALSLLLIYVINKQFFGWSIRLSLDPWVFVQAVVLMVGTSVIAGIAPARLAATRVAAEAMRAD